MTVERMMGCVAILAVTLAAARTHPSLGAYMGGLAGLTAYGFVAIASQAQKDGRPLAAGEAAMVGLGSAAIAWVILTSAAVVALLIYVIGDIVSDGLTSHGGLREVKFPLILAASAAAWYVASRGRRELWPSRRAEIRPARDFLPGRRPEPEVPSASATPIPESECERAMEDR